MSGKIKQLYYRIDLNNPAAPSFCSFSKPYFGTLADIAEVMDSMKGRGAYPDTIEAFARYLEGELDAEHYVCYNKTKLLHPVELIAMERLEVNEAEWEHTNTWEVIYRMRAAKISVTQAVFKDGDDYCRCIRPEFVHLQYNSPRRECWRDVGRNFWGNAGVLRTFGDKCSLTPFVEEQRALELSAVLSNLGDISKLDYAKVCDEIFGDG